MANAKVTELGYLGFTITNADAWRSYAAECVGFEVLDEGEGDRFYLRMDYWHHRFVLHLGKEDDVAYLGWRVADAAALDEMRARLETAGYEVRVATQEECTERYVLGLLKMTDPAGNPTEIFWGPRVDVHLPVHPGRRMHGRFLTGDQGLGHAVITVDDVVAAHKFYTLLGLSGSVEYHLRTPGGMIQPVFMHCNDRQHSLAFGVPGAKRMNHIMLEYQEMGDLGKSHDVIRGKKIPVALQLGMHANDGALTFYSATPSGWLLELGWRGGQAGEAAAVPPVRRVRARHGSRRRRPRRGAVSR